MGIFAPEIPTRIHAITHYRILFISTMFAILHPKFQKNMGLPTVPKITCALIGILCLSRPCLAAPIPTFWETYGLYIITIVAISVPLLILCGLISYFSGSTPQDAGKAEEAPAARDEEAPVEDGEDQV